MTGKHPKRHGRVGKLGTDASAVYLIQSAKMVEIEKRTGVEREDETYV